MTLQYIPLWENCNKFWKFVKDSIFQDLFVARECLIQLHDGSGYNYSFPLYLGILWRKETRDVMPKATCASTKNSYLGSVFHVVIFYKSDAIPSIF